MKCKIIKVCGMRDADNIRAVENLLIGSKVPSDRFMGFIFWQKSGRYVCEEPAYMPKGVKRVGVFVNEDVEKVKQIADDYQLDYIQLHGSESPEYVSRLKGMRVIKAFNIATNTDLEQTLAYEHIPDGGKVDMFLFDTKGKIVGGNGVKFDWNVLAAYSGDTPFILSGGIGPDDAESVASFHHEKCVGIDLNSRFEISPGLKDVKKLASFIDRLEDKK